MPSDFQAQILRLARRIDLRSEKVFMKSLLRRLKASLLPVLAVLAVSMHTPAVQATPIATYVVEENMVNAGTSYLQLPLLQSNGSIAPATWDVYVGSFNIGISSTGLSPWTTALAFCVDPWNWSAGSAAPYFKDSLQALTAPAGATLDLQKIASHKTQIASLYSNYYQGTLGNTAHSAAFQLALWEIVSDNTVLKAASGTNMTIWNDAQALLTSLNDSHFGMGAQQYDLSVYYVDRSREGIVGQNYIVATAVPEPASLALMLLGVASLGFFIRRKA
jgi:hypothetical protein